MTPVFAGIVQSKLDNLLQPAICRGPITPAFRAALYTATTRRAGGLSKSVTTNGYGAGADYALGAVVTQDTAQYEASPGATQMTLARRSTTTTSYGWSDAARVARIVHTPDTAQATRYTTTNAYAADGALVSTTIADGRPRTVGYASDLDGRLLRRDEADANAATGDPHAVWYRFDGRQMGSATNDARGSGGDYAGSVDDRQAVEGTGAFRLGAGGGVYDSGFAQGPAAIDSTATGSEAGSYTVRGGDTLAGIAQQLWGDAGLWYKLADANGLTAGTALAAGQSLRLPAGVLRSAYSDATLTPYDHAAAIGDIQPTTPQPPAPRTSHSKKHCGGFGTVLLAVVAVAVTALVTGPASAGLATFFNGGAAAAAGSTAAIAGGIAGGAVAGVAGSVASQAVGVATGIQDKFSWKGVALAGISAGVGGGLGAAGAFGSGFAAAVARGAVGSAVTQGIGVATGLQSKFDFAGVAAAGVGGGAGAWVGGRLGTSFGASLAAGTASALAGAATRSAIEGSGFGDNIRRAIPDAIGSAIGNALARSLARPPGARSAPALARAGGDPVAEGSGGGTVGERAAGVVDAATAEGGGPGTAAAVARLAAATSRNAEAPGEPPLADSGVGAGIVITGQRDAGGWLPAYGAFAGAGRSVNATPLSFLFDIATGNFEHDVVVDAGTAFARSDLGAPGAFEAWGREIVAGAAAIGDPLGNELRYARWTVAQWADGSEAGAGYARALAIVDDGLAQLRAGADAAFNREVLIPFANAYVDTAAYLSPVAAAAQSVRDYNAGAITAGQAVTNMLPGRVGRLARAGRAVEEAGTAGRIFSGGAYGRLSSERGVIERHHVPAASISPHTTYSGPAIQMDYADHLLTSSHGSRGLEGALYRNEIKQLIENGNMRGAMAREIWDVRRAAVQGGGTATKYNGATREMLGYSYGNGWLNK